MATGTVKWFDKNKGYGFITPDGAPKDSRDVFVHVTALKKAGMQDLQPEQRVRYDLAQNKGKTVAENLTII